MIVVCCASVYFYEENKLADLTFFFFTHFSVKFYLDI